MKPIVFTVSEHKYMNIRHALQLSTLAAPLYTNNVKKTVQHRLTDEWNLTGTYNFCESIKLVKQTN